MTTDRVRRWAIVAATCGASACSTTPQTAPTPDPTLVIAEPSIRVIHNDAVGIARARADSLRSPWTEADVRFMTHMIPHHAQAIVMSRMAASHGANLEVQRLAARIINAQQDEIAIMQQWLADRQKPVPEAHTHTHVASAGAAASGNQSQHAQHMQQMTEHANMPGMLSDAQLKQLDAARGREFDRLFLTFMIQHHTGAVTMIKELLASPPQDEIAFRLAADISADQTTEIARMQNMLAAMNP
jgi:uncharacterized protein (DUF305 family)